MPMQSVVITVCESVGAVIGYATGLLLQVIVF